MFRVRRSFAVKLLLAGSAGPTATPGSPQDASTYLSARRNSISTTWVSQAPEIRDYESYSHVSVTTVLEPASNSRLRSRQKDTLWPKKTVYRHSITRKSRKSRNNRKKMRLLCEYISGRIISTEGERTRKQVHPQSGGPGTFNERCFHRSNAVASCTYKPDSQFSGPSDYPESLLSYIRTLLSSQTPRVQVFQLKVALESGCHIYI